jgi:tetratricopeptide (TPR) repeat protein
VDPPQGQLGALVTLYQQGNLHSILQQAEALAQRFPKSLLLWQMLGAANCGLGRLDQAASAFRQASNLKPDDAAAHTNLGAVLQAQGKLDQAVGSYRRAIAINPYDAVTHSNLGAALCSQGKMDEAMGVLQRAIAINPNNADAQYNLANALREQRKLDEAIAAFQRVIAIHPHHADAYSKLGNTLYEQGKLDEAIAAYQRAIAINPNHADAHSNLGNALRDQHKLNEATAAYQRAIAINPNHADAHSNLGNALRDQHKLEEAIGAYQRAIAIKPDHANAQYNLGNALHEQGKLDEAIAAYQRAIAINPHHADAYSNLGNVLCVQCELDEAIAAYQRAIALNPSHTDAHTNLGKALCEQQRMEEGLVAYRRAIAIAPDHANARLNLSLALLRRGSFSAGWEEHEWRWRSEEAPRLRISGKPLWLGEPSLAGRTILLWGEQGLGDQIQFARYASCLSARGARVILEVSGALVRLLGDLPEVSKIAGAGTPVPDSEFDFHCPLMSLPLALGTDLSTIPDVQPLTTHREKVPRWAERVASRKPRIGIAWSGNPQHKNDHQRSMELSRLAQIFTPAATWISLQKDLRVADRPTFESFADIQHFGADLVETAALCEQCELVISVDTSIAHLAGTLRRPVWVLLSFASDWRWLQDRDDSPWYPTMKLYRQQQIGDWDGVLQRVSADLQAWLDKH